MSLVFQSDDLFRRWIEGVAVADYGERRAGLELYLPWERRLAHHFRVGLSRGSLDVRGRSHQPGWSGRLSGDDNLVALGYGVSWKRGALQLDITRTDFGGDHRAVDIERFHRSSTGERMNRFFFDLLEPTFGRNIAYRWSASSWSGGASFRLALTEADGIAFGVRRAALSTDVALTYDNDGAREELRGERAVDLNQPADDTLVSLSYRRSLSARWSAGLELGTSWRAFETAAIQRDVPVSERGIVLDFIGLGSARARYDRHHVAVAADWLGPEQRRGRVAVARLRGQYESVFAGVTPVLGFALLLPISHGASGEASGSTDTWVLSAAGQRQWGAFSLTAGLDGSWTRLEATSRADAEMEFGLVVSPFRDRSRFAVDLYRLELEPSYGNQITAGGLGRETVYNRCEKPRSGRPTRTAQGETGDENSRRSYADPVADLFPRLSFARAFS